SKGAAAYVVVEGVWAGKLGRCGCDPVRSYRSSNGFRQRGKPECHISGLYVLNEDQFSWRAMCPLSGGSILITAHKAPNTTPPARWALVSIQLWWAYLVP